MKSCLNGLSENAVLQAAIGWLMLASWIDTHCHLDAPAFAQDVAAVRARARQQGVAHCVLPAVGVFNFEAVRQLAHTFADSYALGIHPCHVDQAQDSDLQLLDAALTCFQSDPRLVAVGEIGLDFSVPAPATETDYARQEYFYRAQLQLARQHGLPVIVHVRRSADRLLKHLREVFGPEKASGSGSRPRGIVHAFNGSLQQAQALVSLGFKLGFGGAFTFERAQQLRRLASSLPLHALVLETDAPDMVPQWLYQTAAQRAQGQAQARNEPAELGRIANVVAQLRGISLESLAQANRANAVQALPRLEALLAI